MRSFSKLSGHAMHCMVRVSRAATGEQGRLPPADLRRQALGALSTHRLIDLFVLTPFDHEHYYAFIHFVPVATWYKT